MVTVPTATPNPGGGCDSAVGNLIVNGSFDSDKASWRFYSNGSASFTIVTDGACGKAARVKVNSTGSNFQLYQDQLTLTTGTQYRVSSDARSVNGKSVKVSVHMDNSPYTNYGFNNQDVSLTGDWQPHAVTFTATNVNNPNGRLRIKFSSVDDFYFDNVALVPVNVVAAASVAPEPVSSEGATEGQIFLPVIANQELADAAAPLQDEGRVQAAAANGTTVTITKYYYFGSQRIAMQRGCEFRYLHAVHEVGAKRHHLGSTVMETGTDGNVIADQRYNAFSEQRDSGGRWPPTTASPAKSWMAAVYILKNRPSFDHVSWPMLKSGHPIGRIVTGCCRIAQGKTARR
jgi:hypothetical protein